MYIEIILGPLIMFIGYLYWKKTLEKKYYWSIYPIGLGWFVTLYRIFSELFLSMNQNQKEIEFYMVFGLYVFAGLSFLVIILRKWKQ